jgi:hypothetical protein
VEVSLLRVLAITAILGCVGCGESTLVRSRPDGAKLWVNDRFIGPTPVEYSCSRSEFSRPQRFRLELDGYQTAEGELRKRVMPGRIVGGSFSFGISLLFKRPTGFRDRYDFALIPRPPSFPTDAPPPTGPERGDAPP